jgi:hypothetical protein
MDPILNQTNLTHTLYVSFKIYYNITCTFQTMSNNFWFCVIFCAGQRYARLEMKTILSSVIRNFKIKSINKTKDLQPVFGVSMSVHEGVHIELELRGKE